MIINKEKYEPLLAFNFEKNNKITNDCKSLYSENFNGCFD